MANQQALHWAEWPRYLTSEPKIRIYPTRINDALKANTVGMANDTVMALEEANKIKHKALAKAKHAAKTKDKGEGKGEGKGKGNGASGKGRGQARGRGNRFAALEQGHLELQPAPSTLCLITTPPPMMMLLPTPATAQTSAQTTAQTSAQTAALPETRLSPSKRQVEQQQSNASRERISSARRGGGHGYLLNPQAAQRRDLVRLD